MVTSSFETQIPNVNESDMDRKSQESPVALFQVSCFARIDELVSQGVYPIGYAEERKAAARLIENGLTDPEKQGRAFAEIGMDAVRKFHETVDTAETEVVAMVESAISQLDEIQAALLTRKVVPIDIKLRMQEIDRTREAIFGYLDEFREKLQSVRGLQAQLSVSTAEEELQSLLDRVNGESEMVEGDKPAGETPSAEGGEPVEPDKK